jgi:hypothetical protein
MARKENLEKLKTEKDGIEILQEQVRGFMVPTVEEKRKLYALCDIEYRRFFKSIDGIVLLVRSIDKVKTYKDFLFVEVKTTKSKSVKQLPYGAFFGFTENEEELFKNQSNYRLCIVHTVFKEYCLITFSEYEQLIQNKRIQYQINFKSS